MFLIQILQTSSEQEQSDSFKTLMVVWFCFVSPLLPIGTIAIFSKISMQSETMKKRSFAFMNLRQVFNFFVSLCYYFFLKYKETERIEL